MPAAGLDPALFGTVASLIDKLTSFALVLAWMIFGSRQVWVWGYQHKDRLDELHKQLADLGEREKRLQAKLDAQERLIDRLSGVADRSIGLSRSAVVQQLREHRAHEGAA